MSVGHVTLQQLCLVKVTMMDVFKVRSEWNGAPIPLELEHINGVKTDNRLENLTILCPNCHAQTPTYRGKNKAKIPGSVVKQANTLPLNGSAERLESSTLSGATKRVSLPQNFCFDCGKSISPQATRCKNCVGLLRETKIVWPTTKYLLDKIKNGSSYWSLSGELGVSDVAVRKRTLNHPED